ncbi:MFS transporter [Sinorhizobium sp. CB9]|uniref:MFS transporter n=1 Tax=Sinorhizobium sp. CB9 TaxID=3056948 RepID=UPI003523DD54
MPVGRLSDRLDRRIVAAGVAIGLCVVAFCLALLPLARAWMLLLTFVLGGFMTTIYPVCVAHANDRIEPDMAVAVSGQLILINGIASFLGPIIGTSVMGATGIEGIFIYMATVAGLFAAAAIWRVLQIEGPDRKDRPFILLNERMSQPIGHVVEENVS